MGWAVVTVTLVVVRLLATRVTQLVAGVTMVAVTSLPVVVVVWVAVVIVALCVDTGGRVEALLRSPEI